MVAGRCYKAETQLHHPDGSQNKRLVVLLAAPYQTNIMNRTKQKQIAKSSEENLQHFAWGEVEMVSIGNEILLERFCEFLGAITDGFGDRMLHTLAW